MLAIFKREMRSYFTGVVGYVFLVVFLAMAAAVFCYTTLFSMSANVTTYFVIMLLFSAIVLPLLTMKSFSEEKRTKTEQLLLTSPVSTTQMVLAKFLSAFTMLVIFLGLSFIFVIPIFSYIPEGSSFNMALVFGNIIALLLVGMCFIAIGVFVSSLTENQFAAIVITVVILLGMFVINLFNSVISVYAIRVILDWFSIYSRYQAFTYGLFDIGALIYYISITGVFIFLTVRVFEARKYR